MSRIVMICLGSRGDIAPLLGLGVRLRAAGHEVAVAAHEGFAGMISETGLCPLKFKYPIDFDSFDNLDLNRRKVAWALYGPQGMRTIGSSMKAAVLDYPADVVLTSPMGEFMGLPLAEAMGVPAVCMRFQPISATAAYPPSQLGAASFGRFGNRVSADIGSWLGDHLYGGVIADFRRDLGLPDVSAHELRRRRTAAESPIVHGYSPSVLPRPADWRPGLEITGYWWPPRPEGWEPPTDLVEFLDAGPAPVFVGFGSVLKNKEHSRKVSEVVRAALQHAGVRGVIQAGWMGLDVAGDDLITVGDVPHDWLFPRMAAVVHHCGAGTTAAGLRAGVPTIGVPLYADQPFWAKRLTELGVCAGTIPQERLSVDRLAAAIRRATGDPSFRTHAARIAEQIAAEDGIAEAITIIETAAQSLAH